MADYLSKVAQILNDSTIWGITVQSTNGHFNFSPVFRLYNSRFDTFPKSEAFRATKSPEVNSSLQFNEQSFWFVGRNCLESFDMLS